MKQLTSWAKDLFHQTLSTLGDQGSNEEGNMGQDHDYDYNIEGREKWILALLYTQDEEQRRSPISGRTRMMKSLFLVDRNLREALNVFDTGFEFEAYKYGPFDQGVYEALERLSQKGLIEKSVPDGEDEDDAVYSLTSEGAEEAGEIVNGLSHQEKRLLKWVREKQVSRPLGSLLSYVYREYENMTSKSEIAHRYS